MKTAPAVNTVYKITHISHCNFAFTLPFFYDFMVQRSVGDFWPQLRLSWSLEHNMCVASCFELLVLTTVFIGGAVFCNIIWHNLKTICIWPLRGFWKVLTIFLQCLEYPKPISVEKMHIQVVFHWKRFSRVISKSMSLCYT